MPAMVDPWSLMTPQQQLQTVVTGVPQLPPTAPAPVAPAAAPAASPSAAFPGTAPGYQIGGSLPWGSGGAQMFQGLAGDPATAMANLGTNYATAYNDALAMNRQNYENVLGGFQQTAEQQRAAQEAITAGYGQVAGDLNQSLFETAQGYGVLDTRIQDMLAGVGGARAQEIADAYAAQRGDAYQGLVNRGLGNTTVANSIERGISLDEQKAYTQLADTLANTRAGYMSNVGLAGLGFRGQAAQAVAGQQSRGLGFQEAAAARNTGLAEDQLQWMNSVSAGYPNAGMYAGLAQQFGAIGQANADRAAIAAEAAAGRAAADRFAGFRPSNPSVPPQSAGGYVPAGGGFTGPTPNYAGAATPVGAGLPASTGIAPRGFDSNFYATGYSPGGASWLTGGYDWAASPGVDKPPPAAGFEPGAYQPEVSGYGSLGQSLGAAVGDLGGFYAGGADYGALGGALGGAVGGYDYFGDQPQLYDAGGGLYYDEFGNWYEGQP